MPKPHQLAAIDRMAVDDRYIAPDQALVAEALKTVCTIPLPQRAYKQLLADPAVAELKRMDAGEFRRPERRQGVFPPVRQDAAGRRIRAPSPMRVSTTPILDRVEDVAAQAALDRAVFAGGCSENAETSVAALSQDILKLYYEDYIAQWDSFLRDMRLAPLTDLTVASENLKDLSERRLRR